MNIVIVHVVIYGRGTMPNFHSCSFGKQTTKATTTTKIYRHIVCRIATISTTKRMKERKYKKVTPRIQLNWWSSRLQSMNHQNAKIHTTIHGSSVALWKVFFSLFISLVHAIKLHQALETFTTSHVPIGKRMWMKNRDKEAKKDVGKLTEIDRSADE